MSTKKTITYQSRKADVYRSSKCLNCGAELRLTDKYCPQCSQLNTIKQLSIKDFFYEFFSSIFVYDSRLRFTLKDLLFKPGTITKNYVSGQRLKYANPFRFFLSVSIIYFLAQGLALSFSSSSTINKKNSSSQISSADYKEMKKELKYEFGTNKGILKKIDTIAPIPDSLRAVKQEEGSTKKDKKEPDYFTQEELDTTGLVRATLYKLGTFLEFYKKTKIKNPEVALDSLKYRKTKTNIWLYKKYGVAKKIEENPLEFFTYLMNKTPFFLFFFAPVFALFFWLLYYYKKHTYMEHLVFIFHIFSFTFLVLFIRLIIESITGTDVLTAVIFGIIGPFYFYKALRNFYQEGRLVTIVKFMFLNLVFLFGASLAASFFVLATAAFY